MTFSRKSLVLTVLAIACRLTYCQRLNQDDAFAKKRQCGPKAEVSVFVEKINGIRDMEKRTLSISAAIKISKDLPSDAIAKVCNLN